jgi:hypothetical protein
MDHAPLGFQAHPQSTVAPNASEGAAEPAPAPNARMYRATRDMATMAAAWMVRTARVEATDRTRPCLQESSAPTGQSQSANQKGRVTAGPFRITGLSANKAVIGPAEAAAVNAIACGSQHRTMSAISRRIARSLSVSAPTSSATYLIGAASVSIRRLCAAREARSALPRAPASRLLSSARPARVR